MDPFLQLLFPAGDLGWMDLIPGSQLVHCVLVLQGFQGYLGLKLGGMLPILRICLGSGPGFGVHYNESECSETYNLAFP